MFLILYRAEKKLNHWVYSWLNSSSFQELKTIWNNTNIKKQQTNHLRSLGSTSSVQFLKWQQGLPTCTLPLCESTTPAYSLSLMLCHFCQPTAQAFWCCYLALSKQSQQFALFLSPITNQCFQIRWDTWSVYKSMSQWALQWKASVNSIKYHKSHTGNHQINLQFKSKQNL